MTTPDARPLVGVGPSPGAAPGPHEDRIGMLGGLGLGALMLVIALAVALTGGSARTGDTARS